jgi:hypothetical protein
MAEHHIEHELCDYDSVYNLIKVSFPECDEQIVAKCAHLCCCCIVACCTPADAKLGPLDKLTEAIKKLLASKDDILELIKFVMLFIQMFTAKTDEEEPNV